MGPERQTEATRLDELATEINRHHDAAINAVRTALQNAIRTGELLERAKALVPHGSWYGWLQDHTAVGVRQAQRYMKLYRQRDKINASSATHLSDALEIVSVPKAEIVEFSAGGDDRSGDRGRPVDLSDEHARGETGASGIRGEKAPPEEGRHVKRLGQPVAERKEKLPTIHLMEDLMSVDGLYSLVSVWNSSGSDARRKFVELIDGGVSDIRIER